MKKTKAQILGITKFPYCEYDKNGKMTYREWGDGEWEKNEYDYKGRITHEAYSSGYWWKCAWGDNTKRTYYENSNGYKKYIII